MLRFTQSMLLVLAGAQPLLAQTTIDVASVTCEQFLLSRDTRAFAVWLNGYYHGHRSDPMIAVEQAKANAKKLSGECVATKNTKLPVMKVIEAIQTR